MKRSENESVKQGEWGEGRDLRQNVAENTNANTVIAFRHLIGGMWSFSTFFNFFFDVFTVTLFIILRSEMYTVSSILSLKDKKVIGASIAHGHPVSLCLFPSGFVQLYRDCVHNTQRPSHYSTGQRYLIFMPIYLYFLYFSFLGHYT